MANPWSRWSKTTTLRSTATRIHHEACTQLACSIKWHFHLKCPKTHLYEIKMMLCTNREFQFSVFHSIFHLNLSFKERTYIVRRCRLFTFRLKAFPVGIIISNYLKLGTHHFLLADYSSKARLMVRQQCILLPRQVIVSMH